MKAFILAAGLGTRLKPWTDSHPKALVPVGGIPMLERVILRLRDNGFNDIVVNVHHFSDQIISFLANNDFGVTVRLSDESDRLLDTGGGLLKASELFGNDQGPVFVHNVDILSDAPLNDLMRQHKESGRDISLVTSPRDSSRKLIFGPDGTLEGWHNLITEEYRPAGIKPSPDSHESAFSGIYIMERNAISALGHFAEVSRIDKFPIMDFFLSAPPDINIGEIRLEALNLIDIGKPETLLKAESLFRDLGTKNF
ncbi:MAG: NTP transferase domain-containing protein [Muribaculaceae bacterium]|nr:NTP transferase domain-containing protein [Muribaculaceae bacterium]